MVAQGSVCARLNMMRGYFWKWMQQWIDRRNLVLTCFRTWVLQWGDQKDFVLFHRVKKLRDVWVELGVGVCEDTELECQMRLVEEIIEQREARNCNHTDRYVRTVVGTWRMVRYTSSFVDRAVGVGSDGGLVAWFGGAAWLCLGRGEEHVFITAIGRGCNSSLERSS